MANTSPTYTEIWEHHLQPDPYGAVATVSAFYKKAIEAIPGIVSVEFLQPEGEPGKLWQILVWRGEKPEPAATKAYYLLPEQSSFGTLVLAAPRKIAALRSLSPR